MARRTAFGNLPHPITLSVPNSMTGKFRRPFGRIGIPLGEFLNEACAEYDRSITLRPLPFRRFADAVPLRPPAKRIRIHRGESLVGLQLGEEFVSDRYLE